MLRVDNPPNPYLSEHHEWLGTPPVAKLEVYEERAGSILSKNDSPDIPHRWSVNPYRGCQHGCAYCYARRTHEYLGFGAGTDFDRRIIVKINAPKLLKTEFSRRSWKTEVITFSGVTDCYQPLEASYRLTRRCLEVCLEFSNPIVLTTKSYLVVRDIDILSELRRRAGLRVFFSITFADKKLSRLIEPHSPPPTRQFEAMRRLAEAGIPVGIIIAPIIPSLNDRDIPTLLRQAADNCATTATYVPVRLPGSVADVFLARLQAGLPAAARRVEQRIREMRHGLLNNPNFGNRMRGSGSYWESVQRLFETMSTRYGLNCGQSWRRTAPLSPATDMKQLSLF